jgi:O-antigen/teichoic acid export membrane protein
MLSLANNVKKLFSESRHVFFFTVTDRIFFFLLFLILARVYPTELYGQLVTVFAACNIILILFDLGIPIFLQREISLSKKKAGEFFSVTFTANIIFGIFYFIIVIAARYFFYNEIPPGIFILTAAIVFSFSLSNICNKILSGLADFKSQFTTLAISRIVIIVFIIPFIFILNSSMILILSILLGGSILHFILLFSKLYTYAIDFNYNLFSREKLFTILKISFPLGMAVIFNFLYDKIDIILISKMLNYDEVAFYNIGYGIYKASTLGFTFLFVAGLTRISYLSKRRPAVILFFKKYFYPLTAVSLLITFIIFFLADSLILFIYTEKFLNSIPVLKILAFAVTGLALNNLTGIMLNGIGLFKENMKVTLTGLILNLVLNIFLIPVYGIIAAAFVTIATEYFIFAGNLFYLKQFLKKA